VLYPAQSTIKPATELLSAAPIPHGRSQDECAPANDEPADDRAGHHNWLSRVGQAGWSRVAPITRFRSLRIGFSRCTGASRTAMSIRVPGARSSVPPLRPRLKTWAPLLGSSNINHGLLLPILLHCMDGHGRRLFGPARKGCETEEFQRNAPHRYSDSRRGHAPILDADPLPPSRLITADVGPHTGCP
jgi:hypothetical protein